MIFYTSFESSFKKISLRNFPSNVNLHALKLFSNRKRCRNRIEFTGKVYFDKTGRQNVAKYAKIIRMRETIKRSN